MINWVLTFDVNSHPTVRATAAASTVQNMQQAVGVPWAPAVPSALVPLQRRSVWPARRHTCRSTASSGRPTSTAFKAEVSSETRDRIKKKCPSVSRQRTDALKHVTASHAESRHSAPVTAKMCMQRPTSGRVSADRDFQFSNKTDTCDHLETISAPLVFLTSHVYLLHREPHWDWWTSRHSVLS